MNRFFIVTNDGKDTDYKVTNKIKQLLEAADKNNINLHELVIDVESITAILNLR